MAIADWEQVAFLPATGADAGELRGCPQGRVAGLLRSGATDVERQSDDQAATVRRGPG